MGKLQQNILNKHVFVDGAQAINVNYSDTGLFGIKLSGSAAHVKMTTLRPEIFSTLQLKNSLLSEMLQELILNSQSKHLKEESTEPTPQQQKD